MLRAHVIDLCVVLILGAMIGRQTAVSATPQAPVDFATDVAPILESHCVRCHTHSNPSGGLDLTRQKWRDGEQAIVIANSPGSSLLIKQISGDRPAMPKDGPSLSKEDVETLRRWVAEGAERPDGARLVDRSLADTNWWSLHPLRSVAPPQTKGDFHGWPRSPIDQFVLAKLRENGLAPNPEASRHELIRRLYFDLIGLPPTPVSVEAFVRDDSPDAYVKLVDQLLASDHYGERWARHWLDVARYADTHGFDKDKVRENAWPYRDYVIRSLNSDKPYDRFVREQLAGDVFYPDDDDALIALGFIVAGPFDWVGHIEVANDSMEKKRVQNLDRDDMVRATMETFCSATVGCARCHDHKFDPFTSEDYYALQAVFAGVDRADRRYNLNTQVEPTRTALETKKNELTTRIEAAKESADVEMVKELESVNAALQLLPPRKFVFAAATHFEAQGQFQPTRGIARPVYLLQRGDENSPLFEVKPGAIRSLSPGASRFETDDEGGRRAALAEWILDDENPLTWRSIVNRVWHYHFGRGIVDTPNDFGRMGSRPSHPELLDYLAATFRDSDRTLKNLHRMIVTSATYRQSSQQNEAHSRIDSSNRLLWRMNRRRLDAECVRDAVLFVSGELDQSMYGPGFRAFGFEDDHSPRYNYDEHSPEEPISHRRAIYRFVVRSAPDPFLDVLDCADPSVGVARRSETLTALQSLTLMNNPLMLYGAERFATRIEAMASTFDARAACAIRLAFGREASEKETEILSAVMREHGTPIACRLLFNANEFLFVD